jgi:hypothetical protein
MKYDKNCPRDPVPLQRLAEFAAEAAKRWWSLFTSYIGDDQWKWIDADHALMGIADVMKDMAELAELVGEERARAFLANALERARAERAAADENAKAGQGVSAA